MERRSRGRLAGIPGRTSPIAAVASALAAAATFLVLLRARRRRTASPQSIPSLPLPTSPVVPSPSHRISGAAALDRAGMLLAPWYRNVARDIAAACPAGDALEVGGGAGRLAVELARLAPGLQLTTTDIDPVAVDRATRRVDGARLGGRVRVRQADVAALSYPDATFDVVVSLASLHHWAEPEAGLAEIHRVLRAGGTALIYDFADRIRRLEHDGPGPVELSTSSPFGGGRVVPFRWPWRLALLQRLELTRSPEDAPARAGAAALEPPARQEHSAPQAVSAPSGSAATSGRRARAYVGLGANVGDTRATLTAAVRALDALPGARVEAVSSLYRTRPVGPSDQPDFDNAVVALDAPAGPDPATGALALLAALKSLEHALGRHDRERWGPREIDLDLLVFGRASIHVARTEAGRSEDPGRPGVQWLELPHPEARHRLFVLTPLAELVPGLRPPGWHETVESARRRQQAVEGALAVRRVAGWHGDGGWVDLDHPEE